MADNNTTLRKFNRGFTKDKTKKPWLLTYYSQGWTGTKKSALAFFGPGGPPPLSLSHIYMYIYIMYIQWHAKVWEPLVESVKM